jgi:hypothetical protein
MSLSPRHIEILNEAALLMLSHNHFFSYDNPVLSELQILGDCHVCAVVIHEASAPEILLLEPGSDCPNFYHFEQLHVALTTSIDLTAFCA